MGSCLVRRVHYKYATESNSISTATTTNQTKPIMIATFKKNFMTAMLVGALGLCVAGCQSFSNVPSGNLASITITNQPMTNVVQAAAAVFATHGFSGGQTGPGQFTYTRLGSRTDNLAYGNSMFDELVTIKVVVVTRQLAPNSILVGCNAWLVEADNDPVFEDDHKVRQLRKWPYEQLLKDIQTQLGE
jgi:hypothetical protein